MASGSRASVWRDVPSGHAHTWRSIFDGSLEGVDLQASCPVCLTAALHRWFHLHRPSPTTSSRRDWQGKGSQWQWCSSCHSYEHSSGLVPDWWHPTFKVAPEDLHHDPEAIETQRLRQHGAL